MGSVDKVSDVSKKRRHGRWRGAASDYMGATLVALAKTGVMVEGNFGSVRKKWRRRRLAVGGGVWPCWRGRLVCVVF